MNSLVTEVLVPRYGLAWYPWAVQYFFLIALSYCTLWLSAPGLLGAKSWRTTSRLALLACVSTTLVAPVALLADLHQPLRFWHFYAHPTPWSWMSVGSFILPLYLGVVLALAYFVWRPAIQAQRAAQGLLGAYARLLSLGNWQAPAFFIPLLTLAALLISTGIILYTGAEIAVVKGRPLWNTNWLIPMFATTGMLGACGLVLLLNRISGTNKSATNKQVLSILILSCLASGLIALTWYLDGANALSGSVATAIDSVRGNPTWRTMTTWGLTAGITLMALAWLLRSRHRLQVHAWIAGLLALHVAWMFRWAVLMDVQTVARNTAGFNDYSIALGSSGWLGVIGIFGLWLAAILLIDLFVPWRGIGQHHNLDIDAPPSVVAKGAVHHG
ncbi:NrfD/PsrC family molybdoenzyme membrane anchor subunit [Denitrificimonas caeni]|uniref:Polysulfide reductase NrfD n=1 Tax=Denitrificimonas caeni TaxID=521720 RepID=A0AAE9VNH6_9GAMM|nr:NrfD/PsrC family molybdoenzyme membrane anchor subunit [Denitrificimonas caeni]WBE24498.1 polysulfide reductase NrfD [Denitrificimonas caeni]